jgi:serine protease
MKSICHHRPMGWLACLLTILFSINSWAGSRYLVLLKSNDSYRNVKVQAQNDQLRGLGLMGTTAQVQDYLDHLDMMVIESDQRSDISALSQHPDVEAIEEEIFFDIPRVSWPSPQAWSLDIYRSSDLPWGIETVKATEAWEITRGEGVRVMVLDSGIDERHPDLIGRFEKARTFMGGSFDDRIGHGTHVAGTIVADGEGSGLLGVAPGSTFLMGKVCDNSCSSVGITQGVNWAIEEKVDVVNMSLGGPFMFETQVYQRAEQANIVVVAASGNGGNASISFPAALSTTMAVGAVNPDLTKASFSQYGRQLDVVAPGVNVYSTVPQGTGREGLVRIDLGEGLEKVDSTAFPDSNPGDSITRAEFVFGGLGRPQDFTNNKATGKIALIERGEITFQEKVRSAQNAGAIGVVIYNNEPGLINGGLDQATRLPVMMIEQSVGQTILEKLANNQDVVAELSIAPSDFGAFSGTSMASPHVAGVAALVRAANKNLTAVQVKNLIRETATPLSPNPNNQLGRGLVDAERAVKQAMQ